MVFWNKDLLFCEISPLTYEISVQKEILKRHIQNFKRKTPFAKEKQEELLPNIVWHQVSGLIKRGPGIDPVLQENKAVNIRIAGEEFNHIILKSGDEFSFWDLVGKITTKKGYLDGRVIIGDKVESGRGGGLCNLANTLNLAVVHSPLSITEFHMHSDALAADFDHRQPLANGTSVSYNYQDYRFKNTTDQTVQIVVWCDEDNLNIELRSERPFENSYQLAEEDHHVRKKGDKYYRYSKIYRETLNENKEVIDRLLLVDNKSEIFFDYSLIPAEMIR